MSRDLFTSSARAAARGLVLCVRCYKYVAKCDDEGRCEECSAKKARRALSGEGSFRMVAL